MLFTIWLRVIFSWPVNAWSSSDSRHGPPKPPPPPRFLQDHHTDNHTPVAHAAALPARAWPSDKLTLLVRHPSWLQEPEACMHSPRLDAGLHNVSRAVVRTAVPDPARPAKTWRGLQVFARGLSSNCWSHCLLCWLLLHHFLLHLLVC